ncbi:MAG: hypothetical protein IK055_10305 [Lachnospiraceae bacterium]|nr:hypothetical protein [Lachnospiraceae bacterium]
MKDRTIKIVFAVLSAALGITLILFGIKEAGVDTDVATDEKVLDHMMITIPGILFLVDSVIYPVRDRFRTSAKFIIDNLLLFVFVGFLVEVVYFQIIYYGISRPQLKLTIPALLILLAYAIVVLVFTGLFTVVRNAARSKR